MIATAAAGESREASFTGGFLSIHVSETCFRDMFWGHLFGTHFGGLFFNPGSFTVTV
jgi:hypothetical protein